MEQSDTRPELPCGMAPSELDAGRNVEPSGLADLLARVEKADARTEGPLIAEAKRVTALVAPEALHLQVARLIGAGAPETAVIVLAGHLLPGWGASMSWFTYTEQCTGVLWHEGDGQFSGRSKTPALALLAALLKALIAREGEE